jgi:hypothetical protein
MTELVLSVHKLYRYCQIHLALQTLTHPLTDASGSI